MIRKKWKLSLIVVLFAGLTSFIGLPAAAETNISIDVSPADTLFQVENMKPGDWAPRTVTVENNGGADFSYRMYIENEEMDKLFHVLLLEINDMDVELYNGKLADFANLGERKLASGEQEELELTIRFPEQLGNEYQGLNTAFDIIFTAESQLDGEAVQVDGFVGSGTDAGASSGSGGASSGGGSLLPETATNIFLFLFLGGVLLVNGILLYMYNKRRKDA